MATVYPQTKVGPLEIQGTRVVDANTFSAGVFVALTASGWVLADNSSRSKLASGWIAAADPDSFRVVTSSGQVVEWYGHGLGSAGALLWLSTGGAATTTEPSGSGVALLQVVGKILDADHVQVFPAARDFDDTLYLGSPAGATGAAYSSSSKDGTIVLGDVVYVDEANGRLGVLESSPSVEIHGTKAAGITMLLEATDTTGAANAELHLKTNSNEWTLRSQRFGGSLLIRDETAGNAVVTIQPGSPTASIVIESGGEIRFGNNSPRWVGLTSSAADPTTTELPNDKDYGLHKNTSSGAVFLAYNDGGAIRKVQLT